MTTTTNSERCNFRDTAGRRCRSLRAVDHPEHCAHHAGWLMDEKPPEDFSTELLGPFGDLRTAAAINCAIGRLVLLVARRRITTREAATLGYLYQLGLQSIYAMDHEMARIRSGQGCVGGAEDTRRLAEHSMLVLGPED